MKFLFEITAYSLNIPVIYKVSRVSEHEFIAEPDNSDMYPFKLTKQGATWITESGFTHHLSLRITRKIDLLKLDRYKKIQDFIRSCFKPTAQVAVQTNEGKMVEQLANS